MAGKLPPSPRIPRPLMLYLTSRHTEGMLDYARRHYGDAFTFRLLGGKTIVFVSKPEWVEQIFKTPPPVLVADTSIKVILGEHSLVVISGSEHEFAQKLLVSCFQKDRLEHFRPAIEQITARELAEWPLGESFPLLPRFEKLTLGVIVSVIFGDPRDAGVQAVMGRFREFVKFRQENKLVMMMMMNFAKRRPPEELQRRIGAFHGELDNQIERARQDPQLPERHDVLAQLVRAAHDDGSPLSNAEIRDHIVTLLIQGHTPTSVALAWVMERVVRHPDVLERLQAEAQTEGEEYREAVITETLRVRHPPGPFMGRHVAEPFQFGDYEVPAGYLVGVNAYGLHRREELYPEPFAFRPERWLGQKPGRYTYAPFGGGVRGCIGVGLAMLEMRCVLRAMMRHLRFAPSDQPDEKSRRRGTVWLPREGAQVTIQDRLSADGTPKQPPEVARPAAS